MVALQSGATFTPQTAFEKGGQQVDGFPFGSE
jgi:hypothetical protein